MNLNARQKRIEKRFRELVVKHAIGTATAEEIAKLERYQALRPHRVAPPGEIHHREVSDWNLRRAMKKLGALERDDARNYRLTRADPN